MNTAREQSEQSTIDYYEIRKEVSDLHASEKVFLPRILFPGAKVLDVGCASGGFFNIMRTLEPLIEYTGVDIAEPALLLARKNYPDAKFEIIDGIELPFEDNTFDIVHCTKVLVIEPRYKEMLREMYRVSKRFVIIDIRLLKNIGNEQDFQNSFYKVQLNADQTEFTVPYVVNDADEVANFIVQLHPRPEALRGTGYFHSVADVAETPYGEVCMTILLVQKGSGNDSSTVIDLGDLPIDFSISRP
jgi:ubiquinone/menaquinone biosynthesis C-methylase UbiE